MTESVDELNSIAEQKKAAAESAVAEAKRLADTAAALHADAASKISDANAAAEVAAQDALRKRTEEAQSAADAKRAEAAQAKAYADEAVAKAKALMAEADDLAAQAAVLADQQRPVVPSFRLEGGGWLPLSEGSTAKDRQVQDVDGKIYNHVSDHATGDWVYRLQG